MTIPREEVFSVQEFEQRRSNVRNQMALQGIDTLVLHSASNILYLSGHHTLNLWDYQCLVVPVDGSPFMVLWQFERGRFESTAVSTELELYDTHADPIEATCQAVRNRGLHEGVIAIESQTRYLVPKMHDALKDALGADNVVNGSGIVDNVRNIKSEAELEVMRAAAVITDQAIMTGFSGIRSGVSDSRIAAMVADELIRADSLGFSVYPIVSAGYRAGMPHNSNNGHIISPGETVFIECSPSLHWYHAPLMRTAVLGDVPKEVAEFEALEQETVAAMLETVRPGVLASEVASVAAAKIAPIRDKILFHEVYGYPVGIGFPPTWGEESGFAIVVNNHRPLAAGMVFHIPMTLRINGRMGVGLSQTFVVTDDGAEVLSALPVELVRIAE